MELLFCFFESGVDMKTGIECCAKRPVKFKFLSTLVSAFKMIAARAKRGRRILRKIFESELHWSGQAELNRRYTHPKGAYCRYTMARVLESVRRHFVHIKSRFPFGSLVLCKFGYFRLQFVGL